jgi:predicted nucleic acid-binding protein
VAERSRPASAGPSAGVFLDTGYLLALELRKDENHPAALSHWRSARQGGLPRLVTTTWVFDEVLTYLNSRGLHASAVKVGRRLLESPSVELTQVGKGLFRGAFGLFGWRPDKRYSLTDCVSFVVMRERGLDTAFAFDRHFEQEGFVREPHAP